MRDAAVGDGQPFTMPLGSLVRGAVAAPRRRVRDDHADDEPRSHGRTSDDELVRDEDDEDIDPDEDKRPPRPD